jgi:YD repeat-containing protein
VIGDAGLVNPHGEPVEARQISLLETQYQYDELNRRVRIDRAWRDATTRNPLGKSRWDGKEGMVSTVIEYADNHRPSRIWYETGNILCLEYDGANRVVAASDETGESVTIEYDENSNPVCIDHRGPELEQNEERFEQIIIQQFDALDRLLTRSVNFELPETFGYNALGSLIAHRNRVGTDTLYLHDVGSVGRPSLDSCRSPAGTAGGTR